jgi:hypothetical protein
LLPSGQVPGECNFFSLNVLVVLARDMLRIGCVFQLLVIFFLKLFACCSWLDFSIIDCVLQLLVMVIF